MSSLRPFGLSTWLAAPAAAALLMLTPVVQAPAQAQAAQATPAPQQAANPAPASPSQTTVAATSQPVGAPMWGPRTEATCSNNAEPTTQLLDERGRDEARAGTSRGV